MPRKKEPKKRSFTDKIKELPMFAFLFVGLIMLAVAIGVYIYVAHNGNPFVSQEIVFNDEKKLFIIGDIMIPELPDPPIPQH